MGPLEPCEVCATPVRLHDLGPAVALMFGLEVREVHHDDAPDTVGAVVDALDGPAFYVETDEKPAPGALSVTYRRHTPARCRAAAAQLASSPR